MKIRICKDNGPLKGFVVELAHLPGLCAGRGENIDLALGQFVRHFASNLGVQIQVDPSAEPWARAYGLPTPPSSPDAE